MKKKRDSGGGGGANWMDTYGDMVTLLMCFFILMYSMSSVDQEKYAALAESFNPDAKESYFGTDPEEPDDTVEPEEAPTVEEAAQDMEQMYEDLVDFFIDEEMGSNVSISKGSGYVFISFHDALFFAGNSYTISENGMLILERVGETIGEVSNSVNIIEVLGHTARADSDEANIISTDRFLASNRATAVTVFLQQQGFIDPSRLVSLGYGEWRPMGDNSIAEEQATNRRVELVVSGFTEDSINNDDIDDYYNMLIDATPVDEVDLNAPQETTDSADQSEESQGADEESETVQEETQSSDESAQQAEETVDEETTDEEAQEDAE